MLIQKIYYLPDYIKHIYLSLEFLISSFILSHSFSTLFIDTNSSWLIFESIKSLEIKTTIVFDLVSASNTILSCFFFFFLIIDLRFLISAFITEF